MRFLLRGVHKRLWSSVAKGINPERNQKTKMKTYIIRSTKTGEYRTIAPCDSREHSNDHLQSTTDRQEAAEVFGEDDVAVLATNLVL